MPLGGTYRSVWPIPGNGDVRADQPNKHRSEGFLEFFPLLQVHGLSRPIMINR